jgi:hypothetical protein
MRAAEWPHRQKIQLNPAITMNKRPGSFTVLPAGMKHFAWSSGESIVQIQSEGLFQVKYVNPADDPRNAKK